MRSSSSSCIAVTASMRDAISCARVFSFFNSFAHFALRAGNGPRGGFVRKGQSDCAKRANRFALFVRCYLIKSQGLRAGASACTGKIQIKNLFSSLCLFVVAVVGDPGISHMSVLFYLTQQPQGFVLHRRPLKLQRLQPSSYLFSSVKLQRLQPSSCLFSSASRVPALIPRLCVSSLSIINRGETN